MKYKSEKEIIKVTTLERSLRPEALDMKYQPIIRMIHDKNEKYLNYNHIPMIETDIKNLIYCYNNQVVTIQEFINRITQIVGYNLMFENLNIQDDEKN